MDSARRRKNNIASQNTDPFSGSSLMEASLKPENAGSYSPQIYSRKVTGRSKQAKADSRTNFSRIKVPAVLILVIFSAFLAWGSYFSWKVYAVSKKVTIQNGKENSLIGNIGSLILPIVSEKRKILDGESEGRVNILLLGAGGVNHPGKNLTDTIMIMSLDTANKKVALLSLPRDLYVNIPETFYHTRINSVYQYGLNNNTGIEPVKKTVEEITGLKINYFLVMDFDGFQKIIDDIGGVNMMVERDIYDSRYPGPNYSYETFEIKKGAHKMDGVTALKYVRERHDDPEGDFGRAKRQQQLIQAVKNKTFSLETFLNPLTLNNVLNALEKNIKTNIGLDEIESFIRLSRKLDTQNVTNVVADAWKKDSLLKVSHISLGNGRAFVLVPRVGNFSEVQDLAQNVFDLNAIEKRQSEIEKEEAGVLIVNQSEDKNLGFKIKDLFENKLKLKNVRLEESANPYRDQTIVLDKTGGIKIFTLDEIIKKLPARLDSPEMAVSSAAESGIINSETSPDLIVFLGKDLEKTYSFEEDSINDLNSAEGSQADAEIMNQN